MLSDRPKEQLSRAMVAMALGVDDRRTRTANAVRVHLAELTAADFPQNLRLTFDRLTTLLAPARAGDEIDRRLEPLSDFDVRRVARLIADLHGYLNTTWWADDSPP